MDGDPPRQGPQGDGRWPVQIGEQAAKLLGGGQMWLSTQFRDAGAGQTHHGKIGEGLRVGIQIIIGGPWQAIMAMHAATSGLPGRHDDLVA